MSIQYEKGLSKGQIDGIEQEVESFIAQFNPVESIVFIMEDKATHAMFCECHIGTDKLIELCTVDVPLDPDDQPEYRANREIIEENSLFKKMKEDAIKGRSFSNIVAEYNCDYDTDHPLKIVGGQHRIRAIEEAYEKGVSEIHGIKVYFCLDMTQRLDVQLISNTNIAVSNDLLDRMMETQSGPQLRNWCQRNGLLAENKDFADKKNRDGIMTVREARTFIINYYLGKNVEKFSEEKTDGVISKSGVSNPEWDELKLKNPGMWEDESLAMAAMKFAHLVKRQSEYIPKSNKQFASEIADKASNYAIIAAWAFVAGVLQNNNVRLQRHYNLPENSKKDPLNAEVLLSAKHKSDPPNYRGLGSRTDAKERGRLIEMFYLQAEKGDGISNSLVDLAMKKYHAKQANLEVFRAEQRVK